MKYPEIHIIVGRYIFNAYSSLIQQYSVVLYHYYYRFTVIEVKLKDGNLWLLGEVVVPFDGSDIPCFHELRSYPTKQRAEIAYTALTEL